MAYEVTSYSQRPKILVIFVLIVSLSRLQPLVV